ncbi:hypothetical protein J2W98_003614 [Paenibacillus peoriae]|uniref:HNH nuclease domain-containing protein n=1 Tax=Paenibacillus peoriae TaxID=59893 RepID=A0ABU1QI48_9BACL|nr:HNH endonuclease [Paenibacillus peoriae]MDR6779334.1 hypothetical protein [Paenibacillus peoriae]
MSFIEHDKYIAKWGTRNRKWYESKGYDFTGKGHEFSVPPEHLTKGSLVLVRYKCDICGNLFNIKFNYLYENRLNNKGFDSNYDTCRNCSVKKGAYLRSHSFEFVKNFFSNNACTLLSENYSNASSPLEYICLCGRKSKISFSSFQNGNRCRGCMNDRRKTRLHSYEYVYNFFKENGCELLSTEYRGNTDKLEFKCECKNISKISFNSFQNGHRCKKCASEKVGYSRRLSYKQVRKIFLDNNCFLLTKDYRNSNKQILTFLCSCGKIDKNTLNNFKDNSGCKECRYKKWIEKRRNYSGDKHHSWNPFLDRNYRIKRRNYLEYREWTKLVYERDNYTCQCCWKRGSQRLNAHHLDGYHWCKDKRTDINNGITLCELCHSDFHSLYGREFNTKEQWEEYMKNILSENPNFNLL